METYYKIILENINQTLDDKYISTTDIATKLKVDRNKMLDFRNNDIEDNSLLFEVFEWLYPDNNQQYVIFIKEMIKTCNLKELLNIYKNQNILREDMKCLKLYQRDDLVKDILRNIVVKTTKNKLRETENEDYPLCQG
jgi:hypothetical protein